MNIINSCIVGIIARLFIWWVCMSIWNQTITDILSVREITYWETIVLYIFCHFMTQVYHYRRDE